MYKVLYDISFNPTLLLFLLSFFLLLFSFIFIFLLKKKKGKKTKKTCISYTWITIILLKSARQSSFHYQSAYLTPSLGVTPMVVCLPVSCAIADVEQR